MTTLCDTSDMRFPHGVLRGALGAAPTLAAVAAERGDAGARDLVTFYDTVLAFLHVHHGAEDALLWPLLRQRAPSEGALLDRMEAQHAGVGEMYERARAALQTYAADPSESAALVAAVAALLAELEAHLQEEEREILPLAARTVTQDEWGALPGWAMQHFTGEQWLLLGLLFETMTPAEQETTLHHMPPAVAGAWAESGRERFGAFAATVRGTAAVG